MLDIETKTNVQNADEQGDKSEDPRLKAIEPYRFQPGRSGNPKGRRPLQVTIAQCIREIGSELIEVKGEQVTRLEAAVRRTWEDARRGKTAALTEVLNRGWGKPIQPIVDETELLKAELLKQGLEVAKLHDDPTLRAILAVLGPAGEAAGAPQLGAPADRGAGEREEGADALTPSDAAPVAGADQE